jgi:hypothetical protein
VAERKPRLAAPPPKRRDGWIADISRGGQALAVFHGRGAALLVKNETAIKLTDAEAASFVSAYHRYIRRHEETDEP